ncbi:MAG TPA: PBP1A family penicillin-binding protein [Thermoanaerobaculia bacterium]|jgi:penicillin-binding protein 1B|nr:PBP1A family penicillin-binding protein [Thermoanaerobaculia bacterium]
MQRLPRWLAAIAIIVFVIGEAFSIYIFILNRRLTRELVNHSWRAPTIIVSDAHSNPMRVATLYGVDWRITPPVTLQSIPAHVSNAFLAAEDVRFHHHFGIDPIGMGRALFTNLRAHGIAAGGSTIDQQIIKTCFLSQERTYRRKITEIFLAMLLDARMPKNEILEVYLNDVYLGHSSGKPVLGIDEAARLYFNKRPSELRVDEAAVLAGMIRAPNRDTPEKRPDIARARRDAILRVMHDHDWITAAEFAAAKNRDVAFTGGAIPQAPYPFYLRALRAEIVKEIGVRPVIEGALTIVCEMDPDAQRNAERVAARAPAQLEMTHAWLRAQARSEPLQVALLSVDPRNGGIRALVGGSDYNVSPYDRTSAMHRQPGSAFKTFAYLAAIGSKKATTATLLLDAPVSIAVNGNETWQPHNYDDRYRGRVTLRESFEHSLNVPTVRLSEDIGVAKVVNVAEKFGFDEHFARIPALPLGVTEVSMRELTAAYTPFPNLGIRVEPFLLREVRDGRGKTLYAHKLEQKRVADADTTYVMHTLLRGVVQRGTASRLKRYGLAYVAGKTGTTSDYRDAWFVGYTTDMVTSVWVGFDHGAPLRLSSGEAAIPIWGTYMSAIPHLRGEPRPPKGVTFRNIDPETGMLWQDGCPGPIREVFLDGTAPTHKCPAGFFGDIVRHVFFDRDNFDEPAAITFEQFRKWTNDVDRSRQEVEGALGKLRRIFRR